MINILSRVLIILLVTALIGAAVYFIAQGTAQTSGTLPAGQTGIEGPPPQGANGGEGLHDGTGNRQGGEGQSGFSSQVLLDLLKNLAIISLASIVITLLRKAFTHEKPSSLIEIT
jgi:hypothetical protein